MFHTGRRVAELEIYMFLCKVSYAIFSKTFFSFERKSSKQNYVTKHDISFFLVVTSEVSH